MSVVAIAIGIAGAWFSYDSWRHSPSRYIDVTRKFSVMIPFDTAPNAFPIPLDTNPDDPMFRTYMELGSLASNGTVPTSVRYKWDQQLQYTIDSVSSAGAPAFLCKLLQYYIFTTIDKLQRNTLTVAVGEPAEASAGIEPPDPLPYANLGLLRELADNRFFKPFKYRKSADQTLWEIKPVIMPKKTEIKFVTTSETKGPDRYSLHLRRPGYFIVEYSVENMSGTGVGSLPPHFVTAHADTVMQWAFFVTMHYAIERRTDDGFNPDRYSQWADALYAGLRQKLEQPDSSAEPPSTPAHPVIKVSRTSVSYKPDSREVGVAATFVNLSNVEVEARLQLHMLWGGTRYTGWESMPKDTEIERDIAMGPYPDSFTLYTSCTLPPEAAQQFANEEALVMVGASADYPDQGTGMEYEFAGNARIGSTTVDVVTDRWSKIPASKPQ